jgi:hypothetical protein
MPRTLLFLVVALTAVGCRSSSSPLLPPGEQLRADVYWLADDAREGRLPGTAGADASARYIADRFAALGLKPAPGMNDFQQRFEMPGPRQVDPSTTLSIDGRPLTRDVDFRPLSLSANATFAAGVTFVGYGVADAKSAYDDYAGIDVKGRVVLAMRFEPKRDGKSAFTGDESYSPAAPIAAKARRAAAAGAAALLLVTPPGAAGSEPPLLPFGASGPLDPFGKTALPVMGVSAGTAERLLGGASLVDLQRKIDSDLKPVSYRVNGVAAAGRVELKSSVIHAANVVSVLPGRGALKDEYVVVGAHYDHVGRGAFGSMTPRGGIHNGADDNASGTAALLAIARHLANLPLRRSVLLVAFTAEESGLIGSNYFVKHSPVPAERMVAMVNLDMVGRVRDDTLFVGGGGTRPGFRPMLTRADTESPLKLKSIGEGGFGPSDHQTFAMAKVPSLFFFSGAHAQYHNPDDDADRINYAGMDRVCALVIDVLKQIDSAGREAYVDKFDAAGFMNNPHAAARATTGPTTKSTQSTQPAGGGGASLGVVPDYGSDTAAAGVRIGGARPGSAAEKAGLRDGDVLIAWDGKPITNLYDLSDLLRQARPSDAVDLTYTRGGQKTTVRVTLTARQGLQ